MSQPSEVKVRVAKKGGKAIPPGSIAKVDYDAVEKEDLLTGQHSYDDQQLGLGHQHLSGRYASQLARGDWKGAQKTKRIINLTVEGRLVLRSTFCPTCINFLHRCVCQRDVTSSADTQTIVNLLEDIYAPIRREEAARREDEKRRDKLARRKAFKERKKAGR